MAKVLVVDDDLSVRLAIKIALELEGYDVVGVEDGAAGLEALDGDNFDVAIVDVIMPGMSGGDTIRCLHQLAPDLPVIAISGLMGCERNPAPLSTVTGNLASDYNLSKPFRTGELIRAVRACLSSRQPIAI